MGRVFQGSWETVPAEPLEGEDSGKNIQSIALHGHDLASAITYMWCD